MSRAEADALLEGMSDDKDYPSLHFIAFDASQWRSDPSGVRGRVVSTDGSRMIWAECSDPDDAFSPHGRSLRYVPGETLKRLRKTVGKEDVVLVITDACVNQEPLGDSGACFPSADPWKIVSPEISDVARRTKVVADGRIADFDPLLVSSTFSAISAACPPMLVKEGKKMEKLKRSARVFPPLEETGPMLIRIESPDTRTTWRALIMPRRM